MGEILHKARAVIEEIARDNGAFSDAFRQEAEQKAENGDKGMLQAMRSGEKARAGLERALKTIADNLYSSRARFLMEVIQNADDNKYTTNEIPTVCISIFWNHVKIQCNEDGFSRENIQAICDTGQSSKMPGQGYTGEKGIGFKSVFKIANRAHIRSFPYYFELDQRRNLGMITPRWDEHFFHGFDGDNGEYQTTIVLDHICDQSTDFSIALERDIAAIDPILILFLRRIEQLHLTLFKSAEYNVPYISKHFQRVDWTPDSGIVSLKDEDANTMRHFYKHRFSSRFNGTENRRPNITETDVVLAFPVSKSLDKYMPLTQEENLVSAYLPLGHYGFRFVIQADFLTTSSRQMVDEDCLWNKTIANAIPYAFETAVNNFNRNNGSSDLEELANTWPLYLEQNASGMSMYWRSIAENIKLHLSKEYVVKNRDGDTEKPGCLMFLDWAHDRNGEPMFGQRSDYISPCYPDKVRKVLSLLGVTAPDWDWLCDKIQGLFDEGLLHIKMESQQWRSDLANVILESQRLRGFKSYSRDLRKIPLIPLVNGEWRCAPSPPIDPVYFPVSLGTTIPPGLPLSLVAKEYCVCPKMKRLFQLLGVKDCDVSSVIERIFDYHTHLHVAAPDHVIAQLKYLYEMRQHLLTRSMNTIWFANTSNQLRRGASLYADISVDNELQELFRGYNNAQFLDRRYFEGLSVSEQDNLAEWLRMNADVARAPRLNVNLSSGLHEDFKWLLSYKRAQVLDILHKHWSLYSSRLNLVVRLALEEHDFMCISGSSINLNRAYLPLQTLLEKAWAFGYANTYSFLALPYGNPDDWRFLSGLGVGTEDGLEFYLWILNQPSPNLDTDVEKSKNLYQAIQSSAYSPQQENKVRHGFQNHTIQLPSKHMWLLHNCVWHSPKGFAFKPALRQIYGDQLTRLFQGILMVPNVTCAEAEEYLKHLRASNSTTMADVTEVYVFLYEHHANTFRADADFACIAVPFSSLFNLQWKTTAQCVWDDEEFSKNGLELASKIAIRRTIQNYAPTAEKFFTHVLKLCNAGILELLNDLILMQINSSDDSKRVYLLYERIDSCRRKYGDEIRECFKTRSLVYLPGINKQRGQWLSLTDCIWNRSILRQKYALMPSLNQYCGLFQETLGVPDATVEMLVGDLFNSLMHGPVEHQEGYQYIKNLLQEIARCSQGDKGLRLVKSLDKATCWPCHTPTGAKKLCPIGSFYVNDRQDLFEIFSVSHTFLDMEFSKSKKIANFLRDRGCDSFLSKEVLVITKPREPLTYNHILTQDFRGRADALAKYIEHAKCCPPSVPPYVLRSLLNAAEVWISTEITTSYTLRGATVTKNEGGSSVEIGNEGDKSGKLKIYLSSDTNQRECALITDFPGQLAKALHLDISYLPELRPILQVQLSSLKALLVRTSIISGDDAYGSEDSHSESDSIYENNRNAVSTVPVSGVPSYPPEPHVVEHISTTARSGFASTITQPDANRQPSPRPITPNFPSQGRVDVNSPHEQPVIPQFTGAGLYSEGNRNRNRVQLQEFARNEDPIMNRQFARPSGTSRSGGGVYDMSSLGKVLGADRPIAIMAAAQNKTTTSRRRKLIPNRSREETARDFEVGFLGEQFVYNLLHDTIKLPSFTAIDNWTSSLRTRAGFTAVGRPEPESDFTYKDIEGTLTNYFLQMKHPYAIPEWLYTVCSNGNAPIYRLEVKSTTSQNPNTTFYMSNKQYKLAKRLCVVSTTPSEVYVILRVSGLDALEDGAMHRPQLRVYLDPYTRGQEGVLDFFAPTYTVTASV